MTAHLSAYRLIPKNWMRFLLLGGSYVIYISFTSTLIIYIYIVWIYKRYTTIKSQYVNVKDRCVGARRAFA